MFLSVIIQNNLEQGQTQNDPSEFISLVARYFQSCLLQPAKRTWNEYFPIILCQFKYIFLEKKKGE